MNFFLRIGHYS